MRSLDEFGACKSALFLPLEGLAGRASFSLVINHVFLMNINRGNPPLPKKLGAQLSN